MTSTPNSSAPTITQPNDDRDLESQKENTHVSHFKLVFDPAGVDSRVLNHTYRGEGTADSPYIVDFLPDDARNPLRYPKWKKWTIAMLQAIATLAVTFVSTGYSGGIGEILAYFRISQEVAILGISLFVLGFAIGPLLWAPLSGKFSIILPTSPRITEVFSTPFSQCAHVC